MCRIDNTEARFVFEKRPGVSRMSECLNMRMSCLDASILFWQRILIRSGAVRHCGS